MNSRRTNRILGLTPTQVVVPEVIALGIFSLLAGGGTRLLTSLRPEAVLVTALPTQVQVVNVAVPEDTPPPSVTPVQYPTLPPEWTATPIPSATETVPPTETGLGGGQPAL